MSAPSPDVLMWTVLTANLGYAILLGARVAASRRSAPATSAPPTVQPVARRHAASPRAALALIAMSATSVVYYGALLAWFAGFPWLGAPLVEWSWPVFAVGVTLSAAGLALMAWTYAVFRSWRWRAEVEPGHQLMTDGPFRHIRHPIYLSFAFFYVGAFFLLPYAVFLLHALASFIAYDYRARTEEGVMLDAFGDDYRAYLARTRRFIPGLY